MAVLTKVASGVKRHIPTRVPSSSSLQREEKPRPVSQAPDLGRLSDFTSPFPPVGPGGYTRYYKSRHESQQPVKLQATSRPSSRTPEPSYRLPTPPRSAPPKPPQLKTKPVPRRDKVSKPSNRDIKLSSIAESTSENLAESSSAIASPSIPSEQSRKPFLRHRKRRLLRTPSIERDFATHDWARFAFRTTLDRSGSTSSSQSASTYRTHGSSLSSPTSGTDSDDSNHSSPTSTDSDMPLPLTPKDDGAPRRTVYKYRGNPPNAPLPRTKVPEFQAAVEDDEYDMDDPFSSRRDSMVTYLTARSHFSDA